MPDDLSNTPCWLALTAGAMALMSAHANPRCDLAPAEAERVRSLVARKLISNLFFLREHPQAPAPLRGVAAQAHAHWQALAQTRQPTPAAAAIPGPDSRSPTHAAPSLLQ